MQINSKVTGTVKIALASAEGVTNGPAPLLVMHFERLGASRPAPPRLQKVSVDERLAR